MAMVLDLCSPDSDDDDTESKPLFTKEDKKENDDNIKNEHKVSSIQGKDADIAMREEQKSENIKKENDEQTETRPHKASSTKSKMNEKCIEEENDKNIKNKNKDTSIREKNTDIVPKEQQKSENMKKENDEQGETKQNKSSPAKSKAKKKWIDHKSARHNHVTVPNSNPSNSNCDESKTKKPKKLKKKKRETKIEPIEAPNFGPLILKCAKSRIIGKDGLYNAKISALTSTMRDDQKDYRPLDKKKDLNMAHTYANNAGWTTSNGIRELFQNWKDGCMEVAAKLNKPKHHMQPLLHGKYLWNYYFVYDYDAEFDILKHNRNEIVGVIKVDKIKNKRHLIFENYHTCLDSTALIIGDTSKSSKDCKMIGHFGEGLKMAANVLLFNKLELEIITLGKSWKFKTDSETKQTVVHYTTKDKRNPSKVSAIVKGVEFATVKGEEFEFETFKGYEDNLFLQPAKSKIKVNRNGIDGSILIGDYYKGKVFSDGILIANHKELKYGYNFNGKLDFFNRDRQLTYEGESLLKKKVAKIWKAAILDDPERARMYLELIKFGRSTKVAFALKAHRVLSSYFLNRNGFGIANILWKNYKKYLDEKQQSSKCKYPYFVVPADSVTKKDQKMIKKACYEPFPIQSNLCRIFESAENFESLDAFRQKHETPPATPEQSPATQPTNVPPIELNEDQKAFMDSFKNDMESLGPLLKKYEFIFQPEMQTECSIEGQTVVFSSTLLKIGDTERYQKLYGHIKERLVENKKEFEMKLVGQFFEKEAKLNETVKRLEEKLQKLETIKQQQIDIRSRVNECSSGSMSVCDDENDGNDIASKDIEPPKNPNKRKFESIYGSPGMPDGNEAKKRRLMDPPNSCNPSVATETAGNDKPANDQKDNAKISITPIVEKDVVRSSNTQIQIVSANEIKKVSNVEKDLAQTDEEAPQNMLENKQDES